MAGNILTATGDDGAEDCIPEDIIVVLAHPVSVKLQRLLPTRQSIKEEVKMAAM